MKKILAVSGGIDSMVMLHLFRQEKDVIVAHFDHCIRENSALDCAFVGRIANDYQLAFYSERVSLGESCSESRARECRYAFLKRLCHTHHGEIYTAHHLDDLVESVTINLVRGTAWRGLTPLNGSNINRPLLSWTKRDIYRYATEHAIRFRLDSTNTDDRYLRNRIRSRLFSLSPDKLHQLETDIFDLYQKQLTLSSGIEAIIESLTPKTPPYRKSIFLNSPENVAIELLRSVFKRHAVSLTIPQLSSCLDALRTYSDNQLYSLDSSRFLKIGRYYFTITDQNI